MSNPANRNPFLRTTRNFPEDASQLSIELSKAYLDIAQVVNERTIGLFPTNIPSNTGEAWYVSNNRKQQTQRQVYTITSYSSFNHGIRFSDLTAFTRIYGTGFDGTKYFPLPFVNGSTPAQNVGIQVTSSQVVFTTGASAPTVTSGLIILEWLSPV